MDAFLISGPCRVSGALAVSGAKNAALPSIAAALLSERPVALNRLPPVADIRTMKKLLSGMGVALSGEAPGTVTFDASRIASTEAPYDLVRTMRASILVLGPLLARFGEARVSLPGGCAIGVRPVDLHIMAFEAMGARVAVEKGYIHAHVSRVGPQRGRLTGATVRFPQVTVTGTENVILAATLARGVTTIENAACEPEVADLAALLSAMGARISGAGTPTVVVEGVDALHGTPTPHAVLADRIEAGTYAAAAAITGGDVTLLGARAEDLPAFVAALRASGVDVAPCDGGLRVSRGGPLRPVDVETAPHPGYPTDLQAQWMALMTQAGGTSRVVETIFENRFLHAAELVRLGAQVRIEGHTAFVTGPSRLEGATVTASDLRASAALVLAGLVAEGETLVRRIYHLDRGYAAMEQKLASLGARVSRVEG
ncbi:MAG: UDP-N-acetylglucosamine 1-carboxyvinyltransferase [Thermoanaerobaculia bacterium]